MGYYAIYQDTAKQWRWRYVSSNGNIIGVSSEGYWNKQDCRNSITLMQNSSNAPVYDA